jgi:hypothetical protein
MKLEKNTKRLIALATIAFTVFSAVAVTYVIVSNIIHIGTPVYLAPRETPIQIDVSGYPTNITIGETYNFTTRTRNIDPNYPANGLTTVLALQFKDSGGSVVTLNSSMFYIHYKDPNWEGDIQSLFTWNGTHLVCTALGGGSWNAPVGYDVTAQITFRINSDSGLSNGTLIFDCYVIKQTS